MLNRLKDVFRSFQQFDVRYLVIGGYAVVQYVEPRFTKDLDLWISTDEANAAAVYKSLREFGAPLAGMSEDDFASEGYFFQIGVPPVRIDLLMGIPGVQFDGAWERKNEVNYDDLPVNFISRQDLIKAKRASGRPQDIIDADLLAKSKKN